MIEYTIKSDKIMMILTDFLFLLITGLVSLYPVSRIVKYRDRKKGRDQLITRKMICKKETELLLMS
jgi:hypothetical protein